MHKREELENWIKKEFSISTIPSVVDKQIYRFTTGQGYTFKEIARALYYVKEVLKFDFNLNVYGIKVIDTYRSESSAYWQNEVREVNRLSEEGRKLKTILEKKPKIVETTSRKRKTKELYDLDKL